MNLENDIPYGTITEFNVVVEIPKKSNHKYEYDPDLECFRLDRILLPAMTYPGNYGFIPQTKADDGDPLDVLIVNAGEILRGTVVTCYCLGALDMWDDGKRDVKIIAMPTFHHRRDHYKSLDDFDPYFVDQVEHFFTHYKDFEDKDVEVRGWLSSKVINKIIADGVNRF